MTDKNYSEFLEITGASRSFVEDINNLLLDSNCEREIKTSKSGFFWIRFRQRFYVSECFYAIRAYFYFHRPSSELT